MYLEVAEQVKMYFPFREDDFLEGFEVGAIAALLSHGINEMNRVIMVGSVDQARAVAEGLGYQMVVGEEHEGQVLAHFYHPANRYRGKPNLRLV